MIEIHFVTGHEIGEYHKSFQDKVQNLPSPPIQQTSVTRFKKFVLQQFGGKE